MSTTANRLREYIKQDLVRKKQGRNSLGNQRQPKKTGCENKDFLWVIFRNQ